MSSGCGTHTSRIVILARNLFIEKPNLPLKMGYGFPKTKSALENGVKTKSACDRGRMVARYLEVCPS